MSDPEIIKANELADKRRAALVKARAARTAKRAARDEAAPVKREPAREAVHDPQPPRNARPGTVTAVGRDGEVLTRTPGGGGDPFDQFKPPPGWSYQWNPVHVLGSPDIVRDIEARNRAQGWRPVPASRYPTHGFKGDIVRGTVRLEERPANLTAAARAEEIRDARQLMSDRNDSLKLAGVNRALPEGLAPLQGNQRRVLRTGGDNVRMSIDASLDSQVPRPAHQVSGSDE
jgi:hypothetical protein